MAFGHDVSDAHHFENSAHWATSNDAGTLGSGRHEDASCTVLTISGVVDGAVFERHFLQVATRLFHGFLNSSWHFF